MREAGRGRRPWARFEAWLAGLSSVSSPALFGLFLAWFLGWTVLAGVALDALVEDAEQPQVADAAGRLIPAVGVLFALLTAFVITNEWNRTRTGEGVVGSEADAGIRLALLSRVPRADARRVRSLLARYLRSVLDSEWDAVRRGRPGSAATAAALAALEREVRAAVTRSGPGEPGSADLLAAAADVAVRRRDRLGLAGHGLPAPLFLLTFVSGVVLSLNAVAVALTLDDWVAVVIGGLVVLIALDLALVVAISDPFRGPMRVLPAPIAAVLGELEAGVYGPLDEDEGSSEDPAG